MSRTIVLGILGVALAALLASFVYYYRELRRAYLEDMNAKRRRNDGETP